MAVCCSISDNILTDADCSAWAQGGNQELFIAMRKDFTTTSNAENDVTAMNFCGYGCLYKIEAIQDSIIYDNNVTNNTFGANAVHTVTVKLKITSSATYATLETYLATNDLTILVKDNNGYFYISGLIKGYRVLTIADVSGAAATDEKSVTLTFESNDPSLKRLFLPGTSATALATRKYDAEVAVASYLCDATVDCGTCAGN